MEVVLTTLESQHDNVVEFNIRLGGTALEVAQAVQGIMKTIEEIVEEVGEDG